MTGTPDPRLEEPTRIATKAYCRLSLATRLLQQTTQKHASERRKARTALNEALEELTSALAQIGEMTDKRYPNEPRGRLQGAPSSSAGFRLMKSSERLQTPNKHSSTS